MPKGLGAMGVTDEMLDHVSQDALKDHCHATNPRVASAADYRQILRDAF
jgi:alcohol dehydrogenase class IV